MYSSVAPSGAVTLVRMTPRSSIGASSLRVVVNSHQLPPAEPSITSRTTQRWLSTQRSTTAYPSVTATSTRSMPRSKALGFGLWRSSLLHIIGVSVSATKPDTITAPARVSANSMNSRPVRPGVKASGANTAASVIVIASTANEISRTPLIAAFSGVSPSSMWRKMFSSTTIESSTTRPMASTSDSRVSVLIVNPASAMSENTPIRLTGMVTSGMIEARRVRRKRKTTRATSTTASAVVW